MPGETGATVVDLLVWFLSFPHEAAGALVTRHSPRPLQSEGFEVFAQSGRSPRRGNDEVCVRNDGAAFPGCSAALQRCAADPGPIQLTRRRGSRLCGAALLAAPRPGHENYGPPALPRKRERELTAQAETLMHPLSRQAYLPKSCFMMSFSGWLSCWRDESFGEEL